MQALTRNSEKYSAHCKQTSTFCQVNILKALVDAHMQLKRVVFSWVVMGSRGRASWLLLLLLAV